MLQEYNFTIYHCPGKLNKIADFLSQGQGLEEGVNDNKNVTILPPKLFQQAIKIGNNIQFLKEIHNLRQEVDLSVTDPLKKKDKHYKETEGVIVYKGMIYVPQNHCL